jgi:hypothetical protein
MQLKVVDEEEHGQRPVVTGRKWGSLRAFECGGVAGAAGISLCVRAITPLPETTMLLSVAVSIFP